MLPLYPVVQSVLYPSRSKVRSLAGRVEGMLPNTPLSSVSQGGGRLAVSELLCLRDFSLSFGDRLLLSRVSFTVARGEYIAVLGPNGIGKSSLLNCVAMLEKRWRGEITLGGKSVRAIARRELARRLAYIPQVPGEFSSLTVRQWIAMGRYPYQSRLAGESTADRQAIDRAVKQCALCSLVERPVSTLSGGERQRVLLAAALAQEPEILLLDEPTVFLDPAHQSQTAKLLEQVHREGIAIVEVTHDLNRAVVESRRVLVLARGGLAFDGPAAELMTKEKIQELFAFDPLFVRHPESGVPVLVPRKKF